MMSSNERNILRTLVRFNKGNGLMIAPSSREARAIRRMIPKGWVRTKEAGVLLLAIITDNGRAALQA